MTEQDYDNLIESIKHIYVTPPHVLTGAELTNWMNGWIMCQHDVIKLLKEMKGEIR